MFRPCLIPIVSVGLVAADAIGPRDGMIGPSTPAFVAIIEEAAQVRPNEIAVSGTRIPTRIAQSHCRIWPLNYLLVGPSTRPARRSGLITADGQAERRSGAGPRT